jgi:hypothetical protein
VEPEAPQAADPTASVELRHEAHTLVNDEDLLSRDTQIVVEKMTSVLGPLLVLAIFVGALSRPASLSRTIGDALVSVLPGAAAKDGHSDDLHRAFADTRRSRLTPSDRFGAWEAERDT